MQSTQRNQGVTLVELMIATALLSVITAYLMGSFTASHKSYVVVDQTTEAQQNMRIVSSFMERDVRHAGFMVPLGAALCGIDNTGASDVLYVSDGGVIEPGNRIDADFGATFAGPNTGDTNIAGTANQIFVVDDVIIDGTASYDTNADGTMDSDFQIGAGVIIADANDPTRGSACGRINAVNLLADALSVQGLTNSLGPVAVGGAPQIVLVPAHEYRVNGQLQLLRNGAVFAQGVEDFQFAIMIDDNDDNIMDPGEYRGDGVGVDYAANAHDHGDAREIRMNLVMRTRGQEAGWTQGQFQSTENRVAPAGNDGFRRRLHTSTVTLRNVITRKS